MATTAERSAEDLARAYFAAVQAKDGAAIQSIISDDFVLTTPMSGSGPGAPSRWVGREAAGGCYDMAFRAIEILQFGELQITPGQDPHVAFAEARGVMRMTDGRPYENVYVFRFDAADGRLTRIREYANPAAVAAAFSPRPRPGRT